MIIQNSCEFIKFSSSSAISSIPLYASTVSAGFPSPAMDYIQKNIDLNEELIPNPLSTFFVRVKGPVMKHIGIYDNDVLIVDRSLPVKKGDIAVAVIDGELSIIKFDRLNKRTVPQSEDSENSFSIPNEQDCSVWGVVTTVIHSLKLTN